MAEIVPIHYALLKHCESDEEREAIHRLVDEGTIPSWGKGMSRRLDKGRLEKCLEEIRGPAAESGEG